MLWQETKDDTKLREEALTGLKRYQQARRPISPPRREIARVGRVTLLAPEGLSTLPSPHSPTRIILIPSLINPPDVLDISEARSLLRHLSRSGHDTALVDWGEPDAKEQDFGLADHVERLLIPLIEQCDVPVILLGYCLGGTLAIAAAALLTASGRPPVAVATIAAPWHFSAYDDNFRTSTMQIWENARATCEILRLVPMEVLQTGFWSLDPARTIAKYAAFARMEEGTAPFNAFITLEDWANAGAPLSFGAGRDIMELCYQTDAPGQGCWNIRGVSIDPTALNIPTLAVASTTDRIVPAAAAPPARERINLNLGHVGMMVGSRAEDRLFQPLDAWIKHVLMDGAPS